MSFKDELLQIRAKGEATKKAEQDRAQAAACQLDVDEAGRTWREKLSQAARQKKPPHEVEVMRLPVQCLQDHDSGSAIISCSIHRGLLFKINEEQLVTRVASRKVGIGTHEYYLVVALPVPPS